MLQAGCDRRVGGDVRSFQTAHKRNTHHFREIRIFTKCFPEAWPEWIATEIENRRKAPRNGGSSCFDRQLFPRRAHQLWIERRGHPDLLREECSAANVVGAVNGVDAIDHRNAETCF